MQKERKMGKEFTTNNINGNIATVICSLQERNQLYGKQLNKFYASH